MDIDGAGVAEIIKPPDFVQQLIAGKNAIRRGSKMIEKFHFLRGSINLFAVNDQFVGVQVNHQLVKGKLVLRRLLCLLRTAHDRMDSSQKLVYIERLRNIIIGAHFQTVYFVRRFPFCGEHDNGNFGGLPNFSADLPAIQNGKHDVQQNDIRIKGRKHTDAFSTVFGDLHLKSVFSKIEAKQFCNIAVVLYNKSLFAHSENLLTPLMR